MDQEVSPGRNAAGSTNILVGTGLNDFGEKIAQIFGQSGANVFHGCEECEYKSKHVRNLRRHIENRHKSLPEKRKQRDGEKTKVEKSAKLGGQGNEGWRAVKKERILELDPISSDYIQSLTLPPLLLQFHPDQSENTNIPATVVLKPSRKANIFTATRAVCNQTL